MRAIIFPTKIEVTKDVSDDIYAADIVFTDEERGTVFVHLTQDMLVALWKGCESPRMIEDEVVGEPA